MVAYLATSAFGHLYRKIDCTAAEIGALRKAIYSRTVSIPLGLHNLEQIVLARGASPQAMAAQVRLLLSISNWRVLLKPCGQLLDDDLRALAAGAPAPGAFLRGEMQNAVTTGISELLESDGEELNEDFAQALDAVRREREAFAAGLGEFLAQCVTRFAPPASVERFEEYFERNAPAAAAMLAERAGAQIAARDGEAILTLKSVRMWVGVAMSLACALTWEGRPMRAEEANEVVHAISGAAAADTLVTADARALPWVSRVAIDGLRTTDLKEFLTRTAQSMAQ
ncbi:MAG TPA: hypothetical protein VKT12_03335 [Candidatus Binataceae bacterium]|jgi:hypothetical protein|nr:hypothetical protein [Candidatus Binataceae bacterium]